ncbi:MAG: M28 family peptidase [Bryobacteraceae bacterium]
MRYAGLLMLACSAGCGFLAAQEARIRDASAAVSEGSIAQIMKALGEFETRNVFSDQEHPTRGAGAARRWIAARFREASPRLRVREDRYRVKKRGRFYRTADVVNIIAELPGVQSPERKILISGHYDTLHMIYKPRKAGADPESARDLDHAASVAAAAPGVNDDGSGTAAVLELARVLSAYEWDNTLVFAAFDAEEYGLIGSTLHANQARKTGDRIEAVLNNDIIGGDVDGRGRNIGDVVRVFADGPADSRSRQLLRLVRDVAARYGDGFRVDPVFARDRFGRGGDHTPFHERGYAAVRFTTPAEDYAHQHTATDTFDNASPAYTAKVARVNAAVAAALALAPDPPVITKAPPPSAQRNSNAANKTSRTANIARGGDEGKGYDARLRWTASKAPDVAGYRVVMRATTAPFWEEEFDAGNKTEFVLKDVSIDDRVFGVKAIDTDGNESLVEAYVVPPWPRTAIKAKPRP